MITNMTLRRKLITGATAGLIMMTLPGIASAEFALADGITSGLVIEAEMPWESTNTESAGDIAVTNIEFSLNIEPVDGVTGNATFKWEGAGVDVDEATISLHDLLNENFYLETGLKGIPFGVFNSHMVSDPLVKELADAKETVIQLGYSIDMFEVAAGVFNGNIDESDADNKPDNFFASAAFVPFAGTSTSISWISDMGEAGLEDYFSTLPDSTPYMNVAGIDLGLSSELGLFTVELEYVTALEEWQSHPGSSDPIKPSSWNTEVACSLNDIYGIAVRYEGSSDFPGQPEARYGVAGNFQIRENLSLSLEYLIADFDNNDDDPSTITAKLALEI
ncbi:MAG: LbtU family siderophore porin [Candidatus Sabulitectum sp.]|nr:LbtU family siderophore porin [Candidatus Sabulitectum sp.]